MTTIENYTIDETIEYLYQVLNIDTKSKIVRSKVKDTLTFFINPGEFIKYCESNYNHLYLRGKNGYQGFLKLREMYISEYSNNVFKRLCS